MIAFLLFCVTFSLVGMEQPHLEQQPPQILNAYHAPITERTIKLHYKNPYLGLKRISLSSHATNYIAGTDGHYNRYKLYVGPLSNGQLIKILLTDNNICSTTFNKSDSVVAATCYNGSLYLINTNNYTKAEASSLHPKSWARLESHPTQDNLLFAGYNHNISVCLWDINRLTAQKNISIFSDPMEAILDLKYQQEQSLLAVQSNNTIYLWDIRISKADEFYKNYTNDSSNISWNPTNTYEIAVPQKKNIEIIDIRTKKIIEYIPSNNYSKVAFITSSLLLVTNYYMNFIYNRNTREIRKYKETYLTPTFHHRSLQQTFNGGLSQGHDECLYIYDFSQLVEQNNRPSLN